MCPCSRPLSSDEKNQAQKVEAKKDLIACLRLFGKEIIMLGFEPRILILINVSVLPKRSHSVAQADLELMVILLPQLLKCWGYRCDLPCPPIFSIIQGTVQTLSVFIWLHPLFSALSKHPRTLASPELLITTDRKHTIKHPYLPSPWQTLQCSPSCDHAYSKFSHKCIHIPFILCFD